MKTTFKQALETGLISGGLAASINAVLFFIFHGVGVLSDKIFIQPNTPLTLVPVIIASIFPSVIGSIVYFFFDKFSEKGFKFFRLMAFALLALSFMNPFMGIKDVTVAYAIVLNVMHVVVAMTLLFIISKKRR